MLHFGDLVAATAHKASWQEFGDLLEGTPRRSLLAFVGLEFETVVMDAARVSLSKFRVYVVYFVVDSLVYST